MSKSNDGGAVRIYLLSLGRVMFAVSIGCMVIAAIGILLGGCATAKKGECIAQDLKTHQCVMWAKP